MDIRFAREKDIEQIVSLCADHAAFEKSEYDSLNKVELLSKHIFQSTNSVKCIVAEQLDEIVGYATFLKQFSTWDANFYVYLDCLYLKEKIRGKGVGFKIMTLIKEYAKAENCDMVQWQTPDFNADAIVFYKRLGGISKSKERFFWEV